MTMSADMHILSGDELSYRMVKHAGGRRSLAIVNYDRGISFTIYLDSEQRALELADKFHHMFDKDMGKERVTRYRPDAIADDVEDRYSDSDYARTHTTPSNAPHTVDS